MITFIIISIILIIIIFTIFYYYKRIESFTNEEESKEIPSEILKDKDRLDKELFSEVQTNENRNNLIKNGNFQNGHNTTNHTSQNGYNKIIIKKNPGKTSYVLEQKKTDTLTYYQIQCYCDKNSKYNLYFWMNVNKPNINELDFEKLINVKIHNDNYGNDIPRLNYNIIQKVVLSNS